MPNFYTEHPELKFHLNNPMMERICQLKERDYRDKDEYDYAPQDYADAVDSYDKVLEITGEITGEVIAANAEGVDEEGPHCANGRVEYASGTKANLDAMVKAGLNGMTMPRRYGGLNFPITPYTMCAEIVAQADAGFGNIWSLQDCIETLYEFGNEDQHSRFIPRICAEWESTQSESIPQRDISHIITESIAHGNRLGYLFTPHFYCVGTSYNLCFRRIELLVRSRNLKSFQFGESREQPRRCIIKCHYGLFVRIVHFGHRRTVGW